MRLFELFSLMAEARSALRLCAVPDEALAPFPLPFLWYSPFYLGITPLRARGGIAAGKHAAAC